LRDALPARTELAADRVKGTTGSKETSTEMTSPPTRAASRAQTLIMRPGDPFWRPTSACNSLICFSSSITTPASSSRRALIPSIVSRAGSFSGVPFFGLVPMGMAHEPLLSENRPMFRMRKGTTPFSKGTSRALERGSQRERHPIKMRRSHQRVAACSRVGFLRWTLALPKRPYLSGGGRRWKSARFGGLLLPAPDVYLPSEKSVLSGARP